MPVISLLLPRIRFLYRANQFLLGRRDRTGSFSCPSRPGRSPRVSRSCWNSSSSLPRWTGDRMNRRRSTVWRTSCTIPDLAAMSTAQRLSRDGIVYDSKAGEYVNVNSPERSYCAQHRITKCDRAISSSDENLKPRRIVLNWLTSSSSKLKFHFTWHCSTLEPAYHAENICFRVFFGPRSAVGFNDLLRARENRRSRSSWKRNRERNISIYYSRRRQTANPSVHAGGPKR